MSRISLTVHPDDNVSTLLDFQTDVQITRDGLVLTGSIPFGHKVARQEIKKGHSVIKYGVAIGKATTSIRAGEHVHVHNCS
jgi:altronate dehydratase